MESESWANISTERNDCTFSKRFQCLKLCIRCIRLYVTDLTTLLQPKIFRSSLILNKLDWRFTCLSKFDFHKEVFVCSSDGSGDILSSMTDVKYRGLDGRLLDFQ